MPGNNYKMPSASGKSKRAEISARLTGKLRFNRAQSRKKVLISSYTMSGTCSAG